MAEAKAPEAPPPEQEPGAQPGAVVDPFRAYNFKLEIDGVNEGHFIRCGGVDARMEVISYREGGGGPIRKLPGQMMLGTLTLEYGLTRSPELWNWFQASMTGVPQRKNVSILMLGMDGITEVLRWNLLEAWPCAMKCPPLDALGQMVAIESITITFESFNRG
jgi:phage tail-like protein